MCSPTLGYGSDALRSALRYAVYRLKLQEKTNEKAHLTEVFSKLDFG